MSTVMEPEWVLVGVDVVPCDGYFNKHIDKCVCVCVLRSLWFVCLLLLLLLFLLLFFCFVLFFVFLQKECTCMARVVGMLLSG